MRLFTQKIVVLRHISFIVSPRFLDAGALHFRQLSSPARAGTQKTLILRSWKLSTCYSPGAASSVLRPTPFPPLPICNALPTPFIVVVTDRAVRDQLSRLNAEILGRDGDPFYGAPVVMVVLADRAQPTYLYDGSLVMGNLLNAAHALGWGACWIHRAHEMFDRPEGKALLAQWGIDADVEGIGLCVVGHAEHFPSHTPPRKEGYIRFV